MIDIFFNRVKNILYSNDLSDIYVLKVFDIVKSEYIKLILTWNRGLLIPNDYDRVYDLDIDGDSFLFFCFYNKENSIYEFKFQEENIENKLKEKNILLIENIELYL